MIEIFSETKTPTWMHTQIVTFPWHSILTTNYDELIEDSLKQKSIKYLPISIEDQIQFDGADPISVFKIHGSLSNLAKAILDQDSYDQFSDQYPFLNEKLEVELLGHSIIFIGTSLTDQRLLKWLEIQKEKKLIQYRRISIALISDSSWNLIPEQDKMLLDEANIRPLLYGDHRELPFII